jgi:hypothetical protein
MPALTPPVVLTPALAPVALGRQLVQALVHLVAADENCPRKDGSALMATKFASFGNSSLL